MTGLLCCDSCDCPASCQQPPCNRYAFPFIAIISFLDDPPDVPKKEWELTPLLVASKIPRRIGPPLSSCSLVCHAWNDICRPHIFRSINIDCVTCTPTWTDLPSSISQHPISANMSWSFVCASAVRLHRSQHGWMPVSAASRTCENWGCETCQRWSRRSPHHWCKGSHPCLPPSASNASPYYFGITPWICLSFCPPAQQRLRNS